MKDSHFRWAGFWGAGHWHQESAERIARRLLLVQLAAMAVYQLRQATDDKTIEYMHRLAKLAPNARPPSQGIVDPF